MVPVLGREVVEGQQRIAILDQAGHRLGIFGAILVSERRYCRFGRRTVWLLSCTEIWVLPHFDIGGEFDPAQMIEE